MKIIHVTDTSIYNYDGISTYVNELIESSEKNDDEILVLTTTPHGKDLRGDERKGQVKIHALPCLRFPGKPKFIAVFTKGIKKIIADFDPDVIWIHTIGTIGMQVADFAKGKFKVVYTKHCFDGELWCSYLNIPRPFQWIFYSSASFFENKILRAANIVVYHLNDISKVKDNKFYNKFIHIPPPLSSRFFENKPERNIKIADKKLTLGFCGRCDPDKGIEDTFKGLEIFKRKYKDDDFEFILIGDGPEAHRMKIKYPSMNITITGYVNDVIPYLDKLDGFILSSHQETTSLSSLEAYARGVTIFSVPIGYLSEHSSQLNNFHLFKTQEQLADLIYNKLVIGDINTDNHMMNNMNDFVISYSRLYSMVMEKISVHSK